MDVDASAAMATVFPGVCPAAAAAVDSSVAASPTLMSQYNPSKLEMTPLWRTFDRHRFSLWQRSRRRSGRGARSSLSRLASSQTGMSAGRNSIETGCPGSPIRRRLSAYGRDAGAMLLRLNLYSRKRPSGLRLPAVSEPWPLSMNIFMVL